jgi:hypothetical protein
MKIQSISHSKLREGKRKDRKEALLCRKMLVKK